MDVHIDWENGKASVKDKDGKETGIALPYVVTLDFPSGIILSIRRNYYEDDATSPLTGQGRHVKNTKVTKNLL